MLKRWVLKRFGLSFPIPETIPHNLIRKQSSRGIVCGDYLSVKITNLYRQCFSPYSEFQLIYTDNGFHLKSGFKKR